MSSNNNNPFADAFKSMYDNMQAPSFDVKDLASNLRKNAEAWAKASQVLAEASREVLRLQAGFVQSNTQQLMELCKDVCASKNPEASAAKQAEFAKSAFEDALSSSREVFEIASKAGSEASEIVSKQLSQCMSECSKGGASSGASKRKAA